MVASSRSRAVGWAFHLSIFILLLLFGVTVWQRDRIRAQWWARQLATTSDLNQRGNYLAGLVSLDPKAVGAIRGLSYHESPDVRCLAVYALQALKSGEGIPDLARLASDKDQTVRDSAATALALMPRREAAVALIELAQSQDEGPACAAAATLNRIDEPKAHDALCRLAQQHSSALVRAQAIESLLDVGADSTLECDPCKLLADALKDQATFLGRLALERQRLAAEEFATAATSRPTRSTLPIEVRRFDTDSTPKLRTIAQYAASCLTARSGRALDWQGLPREEVVEKCRQCPASQPSGGHSSPANASGR